MTEEKCHELKNNIRILKKAGNIAKAAYDKEADLIKKKISENDKETEEMLKKIYEKEQVNYLSNFTDYFQGNKNLLNQGERINQNG